jgi:hypothetical protein
VRIENTQFASLTLFYDDEADLAMKEFFIDSEGTFGILAGHLVEHYPLLDDEVLDAYLTKKGFYIFKQQERGSLEMLIIILPRSNDFVQKWNVLVLFREIFIVYLAGKLKTFFKVLEFFQGSCFKIHKKL